MRTLEGERPHASELISVHQLKLKWEVAMFTPTQITAFSTLIGLVTLPSVAAYGFIDDEEPIDNEIVFEVRGDSRAVADFYTGVRKRKDDLDTLCRQPRYLPVDKAPRVVFVCKADETVFEVVGAVFLAAAAPHSPVPALEMTSSTPVTSSLAIEATLHCTYDLSTDCALYGTKGNLGYYHRRYYPGHPCTTN